MNDSDTTSGAAPRSYALSARGVTWLGVGANVLLMAVKTIGGYMLGSRALVVDGLHSASDLTTDFMVLLSVGVSRRPPDDCHPYGHRRIGTMLAMGVAAVLGAAAVWIFYVALTALGQPGHATGGLFGQTLSAEHGAWAMALAAMTIPIKEMLYRMTNCVGKRLQDLSLQANAWHHRSDAFTSVAATAGLAGVAFGGQKWAFLDDATALVLASFLLYVAIRISVRAIAELVDRAPDEAMQAVIRQTVVDTAGVRGFHALRARQTGGQIAVDVHVQVDPELTVQQGHDIATAVKRDVLAAGTHVVEVMVHIEPAEPDQPNRSDSDL